MGDRTHPQTQNVGTELLADLEWVDDVAKGLGHLAAILIDREPTAHDRFEGGLVIGSHAREQRRLEPATMLVGTLEVHVGRTMQVRTSLADARVRHAGLPPDVEDVLFGLEVMAAAIGAAHARWQIILGGSGVPGIGTLGAE